MYQTVKIRTNCIHGPTQRHLMVHRPARQSLLSRCTYLIVHCLGTARFEHFSTLKSQLQGVVCLIYITFLFKNDSLKESNESKMKYKTDMLAEAKNVIIKAVEEENYARELQCIRKGENLP